MGFRLFEDGTYSGDYPLVRDNRPYLLAAIAGRKTLLSPRSDLARF